MGRSQKQKGYRRELEFSKLVNGSRVFASGKYKELGEGLTGDVTGLGLRWEVKARKSGFKTIYDWLEKEECVDALAIKADRKDWLVVMPLEKFLEGWKPNE